MKHVIFTTLAMATAISLLLAQGPPYSSGGNSTRRFGSPYDPKMLPPVGLAEAYTLTLAYIGPATNRFYCVSASCLEKTKRGLPGWTFGFSNTNGQRVDVEISFDREVDSSASTRLLFLGK
jgi:hypothetical protein